MGNASAENLIGRILADAKASANQILTDAEATCTVIATERDQKIAQNAASFAKSRETQVQEILDGAATSARIDGRKDLLAAKRKLLDETFSTTYRVLCDLPQTALSALYQKTLLREAAVGDSVAAADADREAVREAIRASGVAVRLSESSAPVERGFVLYGKSYEKDCSLKAILSELRAAEETEVARRLFS